MKKQSLRSILVLSLLLVAGSAFAQTINVRGDIPFSFYAAGKSMPAGQYSIKSLPNGDSNAIMVQGSEKGAVKLLSANSAEQLNAADATKLVFHVYKGEYFLSQVWVRGNNRGHQIPVSPRERELAKAENPGEVTILADAR